MEEIEMLSKSFAGSNPKVNENLSSHVRCHDGRNNSKQTRNIEQSLSDVLKARLARVKERLKKDEACDLEKTVLITKQDVPPTIQKQNILKNSEHFPKGIQDILGFCPPVLHKFMNYYDFKQKNWGGIKIKKGKFSLKEDAIISRNMESFMIKHKFYKPDVLLGIRSSHKTQNNMKVLIGDNYFHLQLAKGLNDRPLFSIYKRARIIYSPEEKQGKWQEREIKFVQTCQKVIGNKWTKIGEALGRPSWHVSSMYCRHRKHVRKGLWTTRENKKLKKAVKKCLAGKSRNQCWRKYPWTAIAKMVPTRQENQCREHWLSLLCTNTESVKWSKQDNLRLIYFMHSNMVQEEHFIVWDAVFQAFNYVVPYIKLRNYWNKLKNNHVPNHLKMDHEEIVLYLYHNYLLKMLPVLNIQLSDLKYWASGKQVSKSS